MGCRETTFNCFYGFPQKKYTGTAVFDCVDFQLATPNFVSICQFIYLVVGVFLEFIPPVGVFFDVIIYIAVGHCKKILPILLKI
jgi:hypothetical protein